MIERQIHDQFIAWLRKHEIPYIHHRMDRESGIQKGFPDFCVLWMCRALCIEIKTAKGRISKDQERVIAFIRHSGNRVEVCRSCEQCVEAVKDILCEGKLGGDATPPAERPRFKEEFEKFKQAVSGDGKQLFIGKWHGQDAVFKKNGTGATFLHVADENDLAMLQRGSK